MVMVDVLGATVSPVVVAVFHAVAPEPEIVQVPLPMSKVRVLVLLEEKELAVTSKPAAANPPSVRVSVLTEVNLIASARVTVIPEPLIVVLASILLTLVMVADARNVGKMALYAPPEARVKLPPMFKLLAVTVLVLPVKITFLK